MDAQLAVTEDELREVLADSPFVRIYDFRLDHIAVGQCRLRLVFQKSLERPGGIAIGW